MTCGLATCSPMLLKIRNASKATLRHWGRRYLASRSLYSRRGIFTTRYPYVAGRALGGHAKQWTAVKHDGHRRLVTPRWVITPAKVQLSFSGGRWTNKYGCHS